MTTAARRLAAEQGIKVTQAVADQVEATLTAAMVDEDARQAVRSGLLVTALAATGVDEVELAKAVAVPEALGFDGRGRARPPRPRTPDLHVVPDPDADEKARAAAQEALDAAEEALGEAPRRLRDAATELAELEARSMQLQAEIDELKRRLAELEESDEEVDDELGDAEDTRARPRRRCAEADPGPGRRGGERPSCERLTSVRTIAAQPFGALDGVDPAGVRGVGAVAVVGRGERAVQLPGLAERRRSSPRRRCRARRGTPRPGRWSRPAAAARRVRRSGRPGSGRAGRWPRRRRRPRSAASRGMVSRTSRTSNAIASRVARTMCARVVPRVRPMIRPAGVRVPVRRAEPGQRRHEHHAVGRDGTVAAIASVSAAEPTICRPSRSHCTAAPVTKIAPSSA